MEEDIIGVLALRCLLALRGNKSCFDEIKSIKVVKEVGKRWWKQDDQDRRMKAGMFGFDF